MWTMGLQVVAICVSLQVCMHKPIINENVLDIKNFCRGGK